MKTWRRSCSSAFRRAAGAAFAIAVLGATLGDVRSAGATVLRLQGAVVKAAVSGAAVKVYALKANGAKGARLAQRTTNAGGGFIAVIDPAPGKPFLVEAAGGSYVDEVSGSVVALKPTDVLTAIVMPRTKWVTVSPLTHLASVRARALAAAGVPLASAVASSFTGVAQQYNLADIRATAPADASSAAANRLSTTEQRNYGLVLAGISQLAAELGVSAIDLTGALAKDASDGLLDGLEDGAAILVPALGGGTVALPANAGAADLQAAINAFIASARNQTNLSAKAIVDVPQSFGASVAGSLSITTTTLPAWLSGQFGSATLTATGGTKPYSCALLSGALPPWLSLSGDCGLSGTAPVLGAGVTMNVSPPFTIALTDSAPAPDPAVTSVAVGAATESRQFTVTIIVNPPEAAPVPGALCFKGVWCSEPVVTAVGGTPPYSFSRGSLAAGKHPLGTIVEINGYLVGTARVVGDYNFSSCAVDAIGWLDCTMTSATVLPTPTFRLSVGKLGNGSGKVASRPYGINCGSDCSNRYPASSHVKLTAVPSSNSIFTGWSGACTGTGVCDLSGIGDKDVKATFASRSGSISITSASCNFLRTEDRGVFGSTSYFEVVAAGQATSSVDASFYVVTNPLEGSEYLVTCSAWSALPELSTCARSGVDPPNTSWTGHWAEFQTGTSFTAREGKVDLQARLMRTDPDLPDLTDNVTVQCVVP